MIPRTQRFPLSVLTLALLPFYTAATSPWKVVDGSTLIVTSGYDSTAKDDIPLYASGSGSHLITKEGLSFTASNFVTRIENSAALTLNNATLLANGDNATGIFASCSTANCGKVKITNSFISSVSPLGYGSAISGNLSDIIISNTTLSGNNRALRLSGGTLMATDLKVIGSEAIKVIDLQNEVSAHLQDTEITLQHSNNQNAISLRNSNLDGTNLIINSQATFYNAAAILMQNSSGGAEASLTLTDSTINSIATALRMQGGNVTLNDVNINVDAINSAYAIDLASALDNKAYQATIRGGTYQTTGNYAYGIIAREEYITLDSANANYMTSGDGAYAIYTKNGTAKLLNDTITTSGKFSNALSGTGNITGHGLIINTSGDYAYGIVASDAAILDLSDSTISTMGYNAFGIVAENALLLKNSSVTTSGHQSHGLGFGLKLEAKATISDSFIKTLGAHSYGISLSNGKITMNKSLIDTSGDFGYGIISYDTASLNLIDSVINTSGVGAHGLVLHNSSEAGINNTTITTSGESAYAIASGGSTLHLSNSIINNYGTEKGSGLRVESSVNKSVVTLDNVVINSELGDGVYMERGTALDLTLKNGSILYGDNKAAVNATYSGYSGINNSGTANANVIIDSKSQIIGDLTANGTDNIIGLTLNNGSMFKGAAQNVTSITLDKTSNWSLTSDSNVKTLQQNGGLIAFSHPTGFSTLTVKGDLNGSGNFALNTRLGNDSSATDKILIGGNASGSYGVIINNRAGDGAITNKGIPIINVAGNAQSATFTQSNTVVAGNYQYVLNKVSDHDWYLQSSLTPVMLSRSTSGGNAFSLSSLSNGNPDTTIAQGTTTDSNATASAFTNQNAAIVPATINTGEAVRAVTIGTGTTMLTTETNSDAAARVTNENNIAPPAVLAYRPETAGYLIAPYLNITYGFATVGSWHDRQSAYRNGAAWGKIQSRHDDYKAGRFAFDVNTSFVQLGGDLMQMTKADGWHLNAGPVMTLGHQSSKNKDNARSIRPELSVDVGKTVTTAYGIGGYLTAWSDDGAYLDGVLQVTRYSNKFSSLTEAKMNSYGVVLSAEAGYPVALGGQFKLEPQLQALGQYLETKVVRTEGVKVRNQNLTTGQLREGLRLFYDGLTIKPWLQADLVQFVGSMPGMTMNNETLTPDLQRNSWQASAGVSGQLNQKLSAYAQVKYSHSFGAGAEGYTGGIGLEYQF